MLCRLILDKVEFSGLVWTSSRGASRLVLSGIRKTWLVCAALGSKLQGRTIFMNIALTKVGKANRIAIDE